MISFGVREIDGLVLHCFVGIGVSELQLLGQKYCPFSIPLVSFGSFLVEVSHLNKLQLLLNILRRTSGKNEF